MGLVLRGNNVPAIARKLYISENTARDHMKSIYRKADVHSRQELIDLFD
ncbi:MULTISPECIES: helix-turn-helix transcriptional regulator [Gordonibacter]|uniref:Helix-turn-helix transcriptional regulator n=1 Tax=Gordonibacter faecis TaxID=3047475 RepID=A0ABT7DMB3_9ACTN|nr:helix-turn-helix transcriptional regulator [Gordonibacter sp. KGMB12511]MDJ1650674.1 helix-turn-helix transcriptional regulator [Gordonibacter sp. KGMB12511]